MLKYEDTMELLVVGNNAVQPIDSRARIDQHIRASVRYMHLRRYNLAHQDTTTDLVHIVKPNDPIERAVQVVQEVHHLHRTTLRTERREADNIAEVNSHRFELFRLHHFTSEQLRGHRSACK